MSILVIGGAGYIGSHTVRELLRAGRKVVVYDNLSKGHREALPGVNFIQGDLQDTQTLKETMVQHDVQGAVHFAAYIEVGQSMKDPQSYYRNNVVGTLNLLDAMRQAGVQRIIFSSSAAVYGEPKEVPILEEAPINPTNVYGRTKAIMEGVLSDYERAYGMRYIALRYFNVAGADPEGDIGEDHEPETHIIPLIMKTILGQRQPFRLFGTDYPTKDGTCIRDYIHVADLANAHVLALQWLEEKEESRVYNLGNGNGFSNREIIDTVERVAGKKLKLFEEGRREGDPATLVASSEKAMRELGWKPRFANLETIIETAWQWHKSHPTGFSSST